jgi:hypothetical protein
MRVLTAVIEVATLPMLHTRHHLALGYSVAVQLVRDQESMEMLGRIKQIK